MEMSNASDPVAIMIAHDADESDRRADAIRILIVQGGFTLAAALDELTQPRAPQVSDILACSWGYDQTRVDFYQVTKVTAKTVTVREIQKRYVSRGQFGDGSVVPVPYTFQANEKPLTNRRFEFSSDSWRGESKWRYSIRVSDYSRAYLWDNEPCSESGEH